MSYPHHEPEQRLGILVGSTRQSVDSGTGDGTWIGTTTTGDLATLTLSGRQISCQIADGSPCANSTFIPNVPWQELMVDSSGTGFALPAGTGVYIAQDTGRYAEIGIKIK